MPGMLGTGNSWLQEEHMCAKPHLHHSISFPLAMAEMFPAVARWTGLLVQVTSVFPWLFAFVPSV